MTASAKTVVSPFWYGLIYNRLSISYMSCNYSYVDQVIYILNWRPFWNLQQEPSSHLVYFIMQLAINTYNSMQIFTCWQSYGHFEFSVAAILNILNGNYHKNQMTCHILYAFVYSCPPIQIIAMIYSHVENSYGNFEFSGRPFWIFNAFLTIWSI